MIGLVLVLNSALQRSTLILGRPTEEAVPGQNRPPSQVHQQQEEENLQYLNMGWSNPWVFHPRAPYAKTLYRGIKSS